MRKALGIVSLQEDPQFQLELVAKPPSGPAKSLIPQAIQKVLQLLLAEKLASGSASG